MTQKQEEGLGMRVEGEVQLGLNKFTKKEERGILARTNDVFKSTDMKRSLVCLENNKTFLAFREW